MTIYAGKPHVRFRRAQGGIPVLAQAFAWDEDSTDSISGTLNDNDAFSHETNTVIQYFLDSLPNASSVYVGFKKEDADNYWAIEMSSDGSAALQEYVSGTPTDHDTVAASTLTGGGEAIGIVCFGTDVTVYLDGVEIMSYVEVGGESMPLMTIFTDAVTRTGEWLRKTFYKEEYA